MKSDGLTQGHMKRKQKDILKKVLQSVKDLFHVSLSVGELREAELEIIRSCQRKIFQEFSSLQKRQNVKLTSHIYNLNPFLKMVLESWWTA